MAQPIYKVFMVNMKDAYYKLSPEERDKFDKKVEEALKKVGGERIVACYSSWCSENWLGWGVEKFPDIEAVQKHAQLLLELELANYIESTSYLGTEMPGE